MNKLDSLLASGDAQAQQQLGKFAGLFPVDHPIRARVAGCEEAVKAMAVVTPSGTAREALRKIMQTTVTAEPWYLGVADAVREEVQPPPAEWTPVMLRRIDRARGCRPSSVSSGTFTRPRLVLTAT